MRVKSVHIAGYRCIADLRVDFSDLTAFVGSGGVGKSSILYALDWFFNGGDLEERDLHRASGTEVAAERIAVAVTFSALNAADRVALGRYVQGAETTLTRTWSEADGEKLSGNALVFPGFAEVREAEGAVEVRRRYTDLHQEADEGLGLPEPARTRDEVEQNMEAWERSNPARCDLRPEDARHLGGFTGTPLLASRITYVLVGAAASAREALSGGRGSTLDRLLSAVEELDSDAQEAISTVQREAQQEIEGVVTQARGQTLLSIGAGISKRIETYFPGASIRLEDEVAPPRAPQISVRALVSDHGGPPIESDLQGHGLQRAVVIALLHELADGQHEGEDGNETRSLVLAIEEPELYQHPLQARTLAASLETLSQADQPLQVAYSTHSPSFTRPALFRDLRLCRRDNHGGTTCVAANDEAIERAIAEAGFRGEIAYRVRAALATSLREAIFAAAVVLCEGPSDAALLEGVAAIQGGLDRDGIAIADCGSKSSIGIAICVLSQLGIPHYALFDADGAGQNPAEAVLNERLLRLCGEEPAEWPPRAVRPTSANYGDTMETDLASIWPDLIELRQEVAAEYGIKGEKKPRVYREAARRAGEPPAFLVEVLEGARKLV